MQTETDATVLGDRGDAGDARWRAIAAAAGPASLGAVLAARLADPAPLIALPAIVLGVTALTVPALYIATAATGVAPPAHRMARAIGHALAALGVVLLGLAGPLALLAATGGAPGVGLGLGAAALTVAALFGLAALHRALFAGRVTSLVTDGLFVTWAAVALVIGGRLYLDLAATSLGVSL